MSKPFKAVQSFNNRDLPVYTHTFGKLNLPCFLVRPSRGEYTLIQGEDGGQQHVKTANIKKVR